MGFADAIQASPGVGQRNVLRTLNCARQEEEHRQQQVKQVIHCATVPIVRNAH